MNASPERLAQLIAALRPNPWVQDLFPAQRKVLLDKSRFKSVTTSRRSGKTIDLCAIAAESLQESDYDEVTLYLARERSTAKDLAWGKLIAINERHNLGWNCNSSELRITTPKGGVLLVRGIEGADAEESAKKLRGLKVRCACIDEAQNCERSLKTFLRDTLEPSTGDLRGSIIIAGTPGVTPAGNWFDISQNNPKWSKHHWTVLDNPHFPDAQQWLTDTLAANGWSVDDPTFIREYLGRWAHDESTQVFRYAPDRNDVNTVPEYNINTWVHTLGVDFGGSKESSDSSAWVVLASHPHQDTAYVIESFSETGFTPEQIASVTQRLKQKYAPTTIVGDGKNLGGDILISAINARFGVGAGTYMIAAEKHAKRAQIEIINGDLRTGKLRFLKPNTQTVTDELLHIPWKDEERKEIHPGYRDHEAHALLYAHRHHRAFLHTAPAPKQVFQQLQPDSPEWLALEIKQMNKKWYE